MHVRDSTAVRWLVILLGLTSVVRAQEARVVEKEGRVVVTKVAAKTIPAEVGVGLAARDKLGTGESSRAVLQMSEKWFARVDEETDIEITPGAFGTKDKAALKLALGGAFVYSREEEGELKIVTPSATGGLRGTQLVVRVWPDGKTQMQVLEGEVELANDSGRVLLQSGEAGEAEVGQAPRKTAVIETQNLLQWALYYPAVLQPDELGLSSDEQRDLAPSLAAYSQGDLLGALEQYPPGYVPGSDAARLYRAAVLLATGQVEAARTAMRDTPTDLRGKQAVERMLAAVLSTELPAAGNPTTAGEALADSYYQQARRNLEAALAAAKRATELAPQSGFAWTRLAELEFSFGRIREARRAIEKGLALAPRNAQAHALRGYLLSAENRIKAAQQSFAEAVRLDGGLGNAWLGLGLTKIKQGRYAEGRSDLQIAATVEPTRSFYYSYHGKALSQEGLGHLAGKDLALAKALDPKDPTPWLYSAIQTQQENRYSAAIHDMQESIRLNDNRRVYRSRFLLDQDSAVRSSNLALIYQNNGMAGLSVREATRAVDDDYSNASSHLFLANSFDALRDPRRLLLRYETAWFNELLMANLLAPVGGGPLSQFVSQQEYSRLLAADGIGGSLVMEAREEGFLDVQASLFGTTGRLSAGVDYLHHTDDGTGPNNDSRRQEVYGQLKFQASPDDILYTLAKWAELSAGDLMETTDNASRSTGLRLEDKQEPGLFLVGWNHRWAPGVHTLLLGGRLAAEQAQTDPAAEMIILLRDPAALQPGFLRPKAGGGLEYTSDILRNATTPPVSIKPDGSLNLSADFQRLIAPFLGQGTALGATTAMFDSASQREFEIYSVELQQIWKTSRQTFVAGGRWQDGEFDARARLTASAISPLYTTPAALQHITADFSRHSLYAYEFFQVSPALTLIAGGTWDRLERPENFRLPPLNGSPVEDERLSGKFGFTFTPKRWLTVRGVYTESLGGVSFDESVRLEPVQLAGFNQAYRTIISESLAGSVEAPVYKNLGLSVEGELSTRTWWHVSFNRLRENVERTGGVFDLLIAPVFPFGLAILPGGTTEQLAYRETDLTAGLNQLVGTEFALGVDYRHNRAELHRSLPQMAGAQADTQDEAVLQELTLHANWNSPRGWFARAEANWYDQDVAGTAGGVTVPSPAVDSFWQVAVQAGCRFHRNQREISVGVLNLTDTDYRLSPLNYTRPLVRERTFFVRCRLGF